MLFDEKNKRKKQKNTTFIPPKYVNDKDISCKKMICNEKDGHTDIPNENRI